MLPKKAPRLKVRKTKITGGHSLLLYSRAKTAILGPFFTICTNFLNDHSFYFPEILHGIKTQQKEKLTFSES